MNEHAIAQASKDSIPKIDCDKVFAMATEMPSYPGGAEAAIEDMNAIMNRVSCRGSGARYLSFVVTAIGKIKNPVFQPGNLKGCSEMLEKEFDSLPTWTPGKQAGIPVCVNFTIPLN